VAYLPGKFARFSAGASVVEGAFRWSVGFRRERLDTTNFESVVGVSGVNVHSEGLTGILDTTFSVEGYVNTDTINLFFPDVELACALYYRKDVSLGYSCDADVLSFSPQTSVRDKAGFTAELQANGLVNPAA
jgi:hypothetical protein